MVTGISQQADQHRGNDIDRNQQSPAGNPGGEYNVEHRQKRGKTDHQQIGRVEVDGDFPNIHPGPVPGAAGFGGAGVKAVAENDEFLHRQVFGAPLPVDPPGRAGTSSPRKYRREFRSVFLRVPNTDLTIDRKYASSSAGSAAHARTANRTTEERTVGFGMNTLGETSKSSRASVKSEQKTDRIPYSFVPRTATSLRATSFCIMRVASRTSGSVIKYPEEDRRGNIVRNVADNPHRPPCLRQSP